MKKIFMFIMAMLVFGASATTLSKEEYENELSKCVNIPNECTMSFSYGFDFDLFVNGKLMWISRVKEDSMELAFMVPKKEGEVGSESVFVVKRELTANKQGNVFSFSERFVDQEKSMRKPGDVMVWMVFDAKNLTDKEIELEDFSWYKERAMNYVVKIRKKE